MFKKYTLLSLVLFSLLSCRRNEIYLFSTFREPATEGLYLAWTEDGLHWNDLGGPFLRPEVGTQKVMRDPSVLRGPDGIYHMVWTSSWKDDNGFGYADSKDLIHWSLQKWIPVMQYEETTVNVWAPELFYDDEHGQYIIVWASTVPYRFPKGEEEELNNHRLYFTTTKDFNTFTETKLFFDPGYSVIDAVIVKRNKEDYILVFKDNTRPNRNLKVAFSASPFGPWSDISDTITPMFTEGPGVIKSNNEWLIYFDSYRKKVYEAIKTSDFKSFTDINEKISLPEGHKHGTIFKADHRTLKALIKFSEDMILRDTIK